MLVNESQNEQSSLILQLYTDNVDPTLKYAELTKFKRQIEVKHGGLHHKPYHSMQKRAIYYRLIFLGLGALFFFLSMFMHEQSINWLPYSHIFSNDLTAKNAVFCLTLLFSLAAFSMSFVISAEKEALDQFVKRTQRKLARIHRKQQFLIESTHLKGEDALETLKLKKQKEFYKEAVDKTEEIRDNAKLLFKEISKSEDHDKAVRLYNEALLEINDHLHLIINKFKKNSLLNI